jgi:anhydro-N-acetylmuramic acid kinase
VAYFVGLMSGTSLDGVDAVLADIGDHTLSVKTHRHHALPATLRSDLLALNQSGTDELHRSALAANGLMRLYAKAVKSVLVNEEVSAIGAHGQTVRHRPGEFDGSGYTIQLMNGSLLAELTGIDVVCDFRSRDVAAGGQGAPLVPAFHAERFAVAGQDVAVLNLGGIANLTLIPADGPLGGFDCGPGNALLDFWAQLHLGRPYDDAGRWATAGQVDDPLLANLLSDPFFGRSPPKSTGRDLFNADWLLCRLPANAAPIDVAATLTELTARSAAEALRRAASATRSLLVCGGGAFNDYLMSRLSALLPEVQVRSTTSAGVPPDQVEAMAFAWLAWAFKQKRAGSRTSVTGARAERVLGALYPA